MSSQSAIQYSLVAALIAVSLVSWLIYHDATDPLPRCDGHRFAIETVRGGTAPYITLTADGERGAFLLDYGTTTSSLSAERFPGHARDGTISDFNLPTFKSGHFDLVRYWAARTPKGGQLGIIGTDFLSLLTADFTYGAAGTSVVLGGNACETDVLEHRQLIPIRQKGFFSSNPAHLTPGRPNVPIVYLKIGPVMTWAQIDTGYDDIAQRPSIDINDALFTKLEAAGVLLTPSGETKISTCAGNESRSAFKTPDVSVVTETGSLVRRLESVTLVRKTRNTCGGIANIEEPAAQVASSLLSILGQVVFDPKTETLWVKGADAP